MPWLKQINLDLKRAKKAEKHRLWAEKNKEKRREYSQKWRKENKKHRQAYQQAYTEKNKEKRKQQRRAKNEARAVAEGRIFKTKEQGIANKKLKLAQKAERARLKALETPESKRATRLAQFKAYRERNKERLKTRQKIEAKRRRDKVKGDPKFKLNHTISNGMLKALKRSKNKYKWETLVPYNLEQLMAHLEKQFQPGMTWENYGFKGWHIDHVVPKCAFKFTSAQDQEFQKCWGLENLRPLWAEANLKKATEDKKLSVKNLCKN